MVQFQGLTADRATATARVASRPDAAYPVVRRLTPVEAYAASALGGTPIVDLRPEGLRACEGTIPGAVVVERHALSWSVAPASYPRLADATRLNLPVILICSDGHASSLAAAALRELGVARATDVDGGFNAWRDDGFPVEWPDHRRGQDLLDDHTLAITF